MFRSLLVLLFLSMITQQVFGHPVIYKDGFVISSANMASFSDNQVMYSWSNRWATGLNHWRFSKDDQHTEYSLLKVNHLLYRYNGESSQGNIYLHGGIGHVDSEIETRDQKLASMAGIDVDWETRTLYLAAKYYHFNSSKVSNLGLTQVRVGFSPYESGFDQLQSWFMLQIMQLPRLDKSLMITPMVRFFYKNVLWEMGASTRGEWMLNLMVHY